MSEVKKELEAKEEAQAAEAAPENGAENITESALRDVIVPFDAHMRLCIDETISRFEKYQEFSGALPTGYPNIDRALGGGLISGELIVLGSAPSMGKTALALNITENVAVRQELPVAFFSFGETGKQISYKLISSISNIEASKLRRSAMTDADWTAYSKAIHRLEKKPIYLQDASSVSIRQIRQQLEQLVKFSGPLGLIVVDSLQDVRPRMRSDNRAQDLGEIVRDLKVIAKQFNCPVLATVEVSRYLTLRADRRPVLSDILDSGSIEQTADRVLFLYRDVVYNKDTPDKNLAELNVAKNRLGTTGTCRLVFRGGVSRFEPWAGDTGYWDGAS